MNSRSPPDVSDLYDAMFTASAEQLHAIKEMGLLLGHAGIVDRVYEVINERALREKGATDDDILGWYAVQWKNDDAKVKEIAKQYGVVFQEPSRAELEEGLKYAVGARGFSIDDRNTSVGSFYQRLFGCDFGYVSLFSVDGEKTEVPYGKLLDGLPPELLNRVNAIILAQKGYTPQIMRL